MPLERGVAVGPDFKVAQFNRKIMPAVEEDLPGHAAKNIAVLFVGKDFNAIPMVVVMLYDGGRIWRFWLVGHP